jgi:hypothetical protein
MNAFRRLGIIVLSLIVMGNSVGCSAVLEPSQEAEAAIVLTDTPGVSLAQPTSAVKSLEVTPSVAPTTAVYYGTVSIKSELSSIQLHREPSIDTEVAGELTNGQVASVIGINADGDWFKVELDGNQAWVFYSLVDYSGDLSNIPVVAGEVAEGTDLDNFSVDKAIESIRAFTSNSELEVSYQTIDVLPDANLRKAALFIDNLGVNYWVDILGYQVIEMNVLFLPEIDPASGMTIDELRAKAETLGQQNSVRFSGNHDGLSYEEGTKDNQVYFFRWEGEGVEGQAMPPILQIGITINGQLVSYINTLDLE